MWIPAQRTEPGFQRPKPGELVWIFDEYYDGVTVGFYDGMWHNYNGSDDVGVTHWMPIEYPIEPKR